MRLMPGAQYESVKQMDIKVMMRHFQYRDIESQIEQKEQAKNAKP